MIDLVFLDRVIFCFPKLSESPKLKSAVFPIPGQQMQVDKTVRTCHYLPIHTLMIGKITHPCTHSCVSRTKHILDYLTPAQKTV